MIARDARNSAVRRGVRDGLTLLEVVVATAMLATLGVAVMGAISFMQYYNQQSRYRLDGMEVAHRLVTQYIDDRDRMPPPHLPIQQGDRLYRWTHREEILVRDDSDTGLRKRTGRVASQLAAKDQIHEMLNRITVQVYLEDPENPLASARPIAELQRIYSPVLSGDVDEALKRIIRLVQQAQDEEQSERQDRGAGGSGGSGGSGGTGGGSRR